MSRTMRRYLGGPGREGKQDWRTRVARGDRATGLRNHNRDRRLARASLKSGETGCPTVSAATTAGATGPTGPFHFPNNADITAHPELVEGPPTGGSTSSPRTGFHEISKNEKALTGPTSCSGQNHICSYNP